MILLRATRYYNNWVEVLSNRICIMSMFFMMMLSSSFTITMIAANDTDTSSSSSSSTGTNLDVFNYHETINNDYGPKDWGKVNCNDLNTCLGYPDTVPNAQGWNIGTNNQCISCPAEGGDSGSCGSHHNSPINLDRNLNVNASSIYNECIDGHYIRHFDSSCSYNELREKNAFTIERYGLKINQPIAETQQDSGFYDIDCVGNSAAIGGRRWGRMDYPKGWSNWWLLSHIDFHVPSEHTQNGKRYDGEIQIHHYYSVAPDECHDGIENTIAAVTIFLQVYNGTKNWDMLDKSICAWREAEEKNRKSCGLPSILIPYPGCYYYNRRTSTDSNDFSNSTLVTNETSTQGIRRRVASREQVDEVLYKPAMSAYDLFLQNHENMLAASTTNTSFTPKKIQIEPENHDRMEDYNWDEFIQQMYKDDKIKEKIHDEISHDVVLQENHRQLMNYDNLNWYNYFPFLAARTEYYFRYSGSQTMPPCYGKFDPSAAKRANTMAWRVLKDPIRVSQRQIDEMHRLIKERIEPSTSSRKSCQPDTGAAPDPNGNPTKVWTARPLQSASTPHWAVFCECQWKSHFVEDQDWCRTYQNDQNTKYFIHPYNFDHEGF